MYPAILLRLEGALVVVVGATLLYFSRGESFLLFLVLLLAPDLSMVGYLVDSRWGSRTYNAVHTYVGPGTLLAAGLWTESDLAVAGGLIWTAHVGADRLLGYGLKYSGAPFGETHLQRVSGAGSRRETTTVEGDGEGTKGVSESSANRRS